MIDLISFYSGKIGAYEQQLKQTKKVLFYTAVARLISFIFLIGSFYYYFKSQNNLLLDASIGLFIIFLFLVKKSNVLTEQRAFLENLVFLNRNELETINGGINKFDNGSTFLSNESYCADLDIFGEASLYHLLNRTSTHIGSTALSERLKKPFLNPEHIRKHQDAIKEFVPQHSLRENLIAKSLIHKDGESNIKNIQPWLNDRALIVSSKWMSVARLILPLLNLFTLILSLYLDHYFFLTLTVVITWIHVGYYSKYIQQQHVSLGKKQELLDQYAVILKEFSKVTIEASSLLQELKEQATEAHVQVKKLAGLSNMLDQRMNLLVNIFLNSFLLYDVQVVIELEKWKLSNKERFAKWMDCIASVETLTSFSTFAFNHPSYCYPEVVEELSIQATALAHPLIKESERVTNDVSLGKTSRLLLVTGSNMSGKTTYLRTIGINIVLAQCGAPVCAAAFSFKPVHIYTSIRISDSLQDHTSYFMAELKRLSEIKENISLLQPSLVLIDEILRGTNSEDKYFGSAEFVKKLIQYNCLTLFATHDLKLSELEKEHEGLIENYCFESIIKDDELIFDYKVLKGVAQNKNASFLMKKMKII